MTRNQVLELIRQVLYRLDNPQFDIADINNAVDFLKESEFENKPRKPTTNEKL